MNVPNIRNKTQIMVKFRTTILLLLLATITTQAQTYITAGDATGSWTNEGSPYIIEGDLIVAPAERLEIEAGVEVLFTGPFVIEVYGRLEAIGTPTDSIYFRAADTTGFSSGNYNGWLGIGLIGYTAITNENSRFEYCNIEYSAGSGITCVHYRNFELKNSKLANNKEYGLLLTDFSDIFATDINVEFNGQGGVKSNFSAPSISNFEISNNGGTGVSILGHSMTEIFELNSGIIHHNTSVENGGGIAISEEGLLNVSDVEISHNQALNGAGFYGNSGYVTVNNSTVSFNHAQNGAGIFIENNCILQMDFTTISHNYAQSTGGGVYNQSSFINLTKSTIADNQATAAGGLYYELYTSGNNTINSSIIWNNSQESVSVALIAPEVTFSDVEGGFEGEGNIDQDPLFAQSDNNDYHLTWANFPVENEFTSPCIDAGDYNLNVDPDGTAADMGAYYYHQEMFMTKVNENSWMQTTEIYPNPATSAIYVNGTDDIQTIDITNLSGQVVKHLEANGAINHIDLNDLQTAVYLVIMKDAVGNSVTKKLIKQ